MKVGDQMGSEVGSLQEEEAVGAHRFYPKK